MNIYLCLVLLFASSIASIADSDSNRTNNILDDNDASNNQNSIVYQQLISTQSNINNLTSGFCYTGHSGTKKAYLDRSYRQYFHNNSPNLALIYPFCLHVGELGNRLGNYFTELACAEVTGLHFITVHHKWDLSGSHHGNSSSQLDEAARLAFLSALPSVRENPKPSTEEEARSTIEAKCKCTRYCWGNPEAPWVKTTATIGVVLRRAVKAYYRSYQDSMKKAGVVPVTTVDMATDYTNAKTDEQLPIIPDVALQYRCGDNLGFSYMYGILPFNAFKSRIPASAKYIYVLSDHPTRAPHSVFTGRCQSILEALFQYLRAGWPSATIVVKRGGDLFLDYVRLTFANVTICSASTYCFWPAISNPSIAHFPLSAVIAGADSKELAPDFGPKFQWITSPLIISDFRKYRPWNAVIDVLKGDKEPL